MRYRGEYVLRFALVNPTGTSKLKLTNDQGGAMASKLGDELFKVRQLRGLSLSAVATPAGLSATYLQKLERGEVESPSPHNLFRLAEQLKIDYAILFELAGYPLPVHRQQSATSASRRKRSASVDPLVARGSVVRQAFENEEMTDDEIDQLARYLRFIRQERPSD